MLVSLIFFLGASRRVLDFLTSMIFAAGCAFICAAPRATAGRNDEVPLTHNERRRGQRHGHRDK
jgi:hypothetical protein